MPTRKSAEDKPQIQRFREAARDAGAGMSKEEFGRVVGRVAKPKPEAVDQEEESDQATDDQS